MLMHSGFWCGSLKDRDHSSDPSVGERIILKFILNKSANRAWTELIWLRIETSGGLLNFSGP
jgi:hypothetical protein